MTHEEIDNAIAVMQAYKEGKTIQYRHVCKEWSDCTGEPLWDFYHIEYRVKPEPEYHPFKNAKEVMEAIKEHGAWIRNKDGSRPCSIIEINDDEIYFGFEGVLPLKDAFECETFTDGTPFGKLED